MIRRIIAAVVMAVATLTFSAPADASVREQIEEYAGATVPVGVDAGGVATLLGVDGTVRCKIGAACFELERDDDEIRISIADKSEATVAARIEVYRFNGERMELRHWASYCGDVSIVRLDNDDLLVVQPLLHSTNLTCSTPATRGEVHATIEG